MVWQVVVWSHLWFPQTTLCGASAAISQSLLQKCDVNLENVAFLTFSLCHTLLVFDIPPICLSSSRKTDPPGEPGAHLYLGSSAVLRQATDVLIEWGNWIMVPGNEFSTFGLRHPSQTDSYYLFRDPEARVANYTPHNSPNQWRKKKRKKETTPGHFYCLSQRTGTVPVCMSVWQKEGEKEREIEMKQSSPYVKSHSNILAISHHLAYIIWEV